MPTSVIGPVIGAVAGGLLSGGGDDDEPAGQTTATQMNIPWPGIQSYLTDLYARAQGQANQGAYQGPYIAPESAYSRQGIEALAAGANDPRSLMARAQGQLGRTIGGEYLSVGANPYLQGAVEQALNQVRRNVSSQFSGDAYGGAANQEWLAKSMAETALPIYANAYQQERQNQLNALNLAPGFQTWNAGQLLQAGGLEDTRRAAEVAAGKEQFYAPWDVLSRYGTILGSVATPSSSTVSQPYYTNPMANLLGGALAGAQLGGQIQGWFPSSSPNATGGANTAGWGTGAGFGNQDYGLFF